MEKQQQHHTAVDNKINTINVHTLWWKRKYGARFIGSINACLLVLADERGIVVVWERERALFHICRSTKVLDFLLHKKCMSLIGQGVQKEIWNCFRAYSKSNYYWAESFQHGCNEIGRNPKNDLIIQSHLFSPIMKIICEWIWNASTQKWDLTLFRRCK